MLARTGRTTDEVSWSPLPMFHLNLTGLSIAGTMLIQGTAAISPRFSVSGFWPEMERTGARVVYLVGAMPSMIAKMDDTPELLRCRGQIRMAYAAPFSADDRRIWQDRFGVAVAGGDLYGLTEASPLMTLELADEQGPPDVRIFDDDNRELGPEQAGEIVCRPRRRGVMFSGYWQRPDAWAAAVQDLWFHTGDLGKFDEQGYFYFVDRKKDYLRRRGENISSQEMEITYLKHPDIAEVAVHAVLSGLGDDDVKVTAVLRADAELTAAALFEWSKDFALPRYIEFRSELPRSVFGRVHKYQLRDDGCTPETWDREREDVTWDRR
jgi:crotonobetaine/carnitine-CoA ligase